MTVRNYDPIDQNRPPKDQIEEFLSRFLDWNTNEVRVNAAFTGSVTVSLDANTDNVLVKGEDDGASVRTLRTDSDGKLIVQTNGDTGVEIRHMANTSAPTGGVTENLVNALGGTIINTEAVGSGNNLEISFDGGTSFLPLLPGAGIQWEGNNSSIDLRGAPNAASYAGIYSSRQ